VELQIQIGAGHICGTNCDKDLLNIF